MNTAFVAVRNGEAIGRAAVPTSTVEVFHAAILEATHAGARVAALFAVHGEPNELWCALADPADGVVRLGRAALIGDRYPSLTPRLAAVQLFEREIYEQFGIFPIDHPWLKPVRFAPPLKSIGETPKTTIGVMEYYRVDGDEVHEVAVGPVHAGVIEPGHFRFMCHGEEVLHLEISLGYQHRGVERALIGGPNKRSIHYTETLSGDTSVGHTLAYTQIVEALAGCVVPARALALRGVALELERLGNHTGDLGALSGDVGYLPTASFCGRLRGDWLNLTAEICGNRLGRGLVVPGGVGFAVDAARAASMVARVDRIVADLMPSMQLLWDSAGVMSRFEDIGRVTGETARAVGLVGVAARASGLERDVRVDFPAGIYRFEQLPISVWPSGDVFGRAWVRALEVDRSAAFVRERLLHLPDSEDRAPVGTIAADSVAVSLVEAWRGEVCHVAITGDDGKFLAYKVVDPSFHNWMGLAMALRGQQISDFPVCNKSFNLSYCGFDL